GRERGGEEALSRLGRQGSRGGSFRPLERRQEHRPRQDRRLLDPRACLHRAGPLVRNPRRGGSAGDRESDARKGDQASGGKSEIRISKSEISTNFEIGYRPSVGEIPTLRFEFRISRFGFVSSFVLRISSFSLTTFP